MKRNFVMGILLAPVLLLSVWGVKTLTAPGVTVSLEEEKEILEELNYSTDKGNQLLPTFPLSFDMDGKIVQKKLSDFQGKPTILHVWATWCGPCLKELPEFNDAVASLKQKVNIVGINVDMDDNIQVVHKKVSDFWGEQKYQKIPMILDHTAKLVRALGVSGVPVTIFLNTAGKEIGRINGVFYWSDPKVKIILNRILEDASQKEKT